MIKRLFKAAFSASNRDIFLFRNTGRKDRIIKYRNYFLTGDLELEFIPHFLNDYKVEGFDLYNLPGEFWEILFLVIRKQENEEKLLVLSQKLNEKVVSFNSLLEISAFLISFGLFSSALEMREKAILNLLTYKNSFFKSWKYSELLLAAALENQNNKLIKDSLLKVKLLNLSPKRNMYFKFLDYNYNGSPLRLSLDESQYQNLIFNKNIAVVGPLPLSEKEVNEIETYDLRIGLNISNSKDNYLSKQNLEVDIIYNDNKITQKLVNIAYGQISDNVKAIVVRNKNFIKDKNLKGKCLMRVIDGTNQFSVGGGLNLGQRILLDILIFKPSNLKIFGVDMYASNSYGKYYEGGTPNYTNSFVHHNPIINFFFMRYLWKNNMIKCNENLAEVLTGGLDNYLKILRNNYY